jgi:hypothetical protein
VDYVISPTKLARSLGDVLAKILYRQDSFVLERNGIPMARLAPTEGSRCSVGEALAS